MSLHPATGILAVVLLASTVCAVDADAQQPPKAPVNKAPAAPGKEPVKAIPRAASQPPASAGGLVVFIDPDTGQIRQPDAAEIGALSADPSPTDLNGAVSPDIRRPVAAPPAPIMIRGPEGSVGVRLGEDSHSYMVVTRTPDGKLAEDCVTGDQAAAALVSKGVTPKNAADPKKAKKEVLDDK